MDILHLTATFGRLEHQELTLSPGLNVLYAPNETGKSTWGAFIRTMLYGLSTRERGPLADKNRFAPWRGAAMQGRMAVSEAKDAYTLLRTTKRASTPTGAAESVAPALDEIVGSINTRRERLFRAMDVILEQHARAIGQQGLLMQRSMSSRISHESLRVESLASRRCLSDPMTIVSDRETSVLHVEQRLLDVLPRSLERKGRELDSLASRLSGVGPRIVRPYEARVGSLAATLDALSPLKVLGRGYAIARDSDGHVVTNASALAPGDAVSVRLGEGSFEAAVTGVSK